MPTTTTHDNDDDYHHDDDDDHHHLLHHLHHHRHGHHPPRAAYVYLRRPRAGQAARVCPGGPGGASVSAGRPGYDAMVLRRPPGGRGRLLLRFLESGTKTFRFFGLWLRSPWGPGTRSYAKPPFFLRPALV